MSDSANEKERLLHITFDRLAKEYPEGLYDFLYTRDRGTYDEINLLEDEINANFLNRGSVSNLKALLRAYWTVHMKAIRQFKKNGEHYSMLNETRQERIEQRETAHP